MTVILTCMENSSRNLQLRNIDWWPVASEIVRAGILDIQREQTLVYHLGTQVTLSKAAAICEHLTRLLNANTVPNDIGKETAEMVAKFAASSSGFEVG